MKKKKKIMIGIVAVIIAAFIILAVVFALLPRVSIHPESVKGTTRFFYEEVDSRTMIDQEDMEKIAKILNGKILHQGYPKGIFTEDVSITIGDVTYCIACDMYPNVYLLEQGKYIKLSNEESNALRTILESYGFIFPCI